MNETGDKVETLIPEPMLLEDADGKIKVADKLRDRAYDSVDAMSAQPQDRDPRSPGSSPHIVDPATMPLAVPGKDATAVALDPAGLPVIETEAPLELKPLNPETPDPNL